MRSPESACPRCESMQPFRPLKKMVKKGKHEYMEIYIRCRVCNYTKILRKTSIEIENMLRFRRRLALTIDKEETLYGVASLQLYDRYDDLTLKIAKMRRALTEKITDDIN